jgi:aminoglycoside phosphotransferase family enzyme
MGSGEEQDKIVCWLGSYGAYPHRPRQVEHIETHISHVFLAGPYVYKFKKPVKYDFLDFSTVAAREHACRDEVRLNRRSAPDTYLGVVPVILTPSGDYRLDGAGQVIEWLVEMKRLPSERMLDVLLRESDLRREHIDRLA